MRNRPWRTGLTCATLTLLGFSLVSLTSMSTALRIDKYLLGPSTASGEGVLLRQPGWEGLERGAYQQLSRRFGPARTLPRYWYQQPALLWGAGGQRVHDVLGR